MCAEARIYNGVSRLLRRLVKGSGQNLGSMICSPQLLVIIMMVQIITYPMMTMTMTILMIVIMGQII